MLVLGIFYDLVKKSGLVCQTITICLDILCDKIELSAVHDLSGMPATKVKVLVGQLEREKLLLEGQLRNIEWKMDQESKSYHDAKQKLKNAESEIIKANDNLKQYDHRL